MTRTAAALLAVMLVHCAHPPAPATVEASTPSPATSTATSTPADAPVTAEDLVDHSGDSPQTAIAVPADSPDGGEVFENRWIYGQYGRFRRLGGGTGTLEGRRYNVVKIELTSGEKKSVYFDITELWAKSLQQQP